ncbi:DUF7657 domain-containing protein [Microbacterium telephonicum]|uniref:4-amino-4-deoxy-L-arabinose transferase-like glycosyltransferase n=1 Tax=Microbacterium telephonicum TaxID=1714841 RepID=A0A498BWM1_9MICO|nr:hypothetical protein [Microbacterium telephonicum]RLK47762.1 hypothetical protein C7474_2359 [Microbacterium telephonicum]
MIAAPLVVYLLLCLLGITNSNIGIDALRQDPSDPTGLQIGSSQGIRSDEWGTESPLWLGQMARGGAADPTPLSVSNDFFAQLPSGPASAVVFFDGTALAAGQWIPAEILFAAKWWLPTLLLFLGLPFWFRWVAGSARWGYLAAVLITIAPGSAWWSGRPVNTLGFVAAGCALALVGAEAVGARRWVRATVAILASGILLARLPSYYQPLAIVIGIPLVLATAAFLLCQRDSWRARLTALGAIAASGALWTGLLLWENREALIAGLTTAYPGDRQSTGSALSPGMVFGASNLGWLESFGYEAPLNQTELSSAFTLLLPVVVVLWAASRWRGGVAHAAALIPIVAVAAFWLSWCTISWGSWGAALPLVNRVPNTRAMLGVGYLAILAFCLFMAQWKTSRRQAVPLTAAVTAGFLSGYAGSSLQSSQLPQLTTWMIWLCAAVSAAVVYAVVRWSNSWLAWSAMAVAAASLTFAATPILVGVGDLRASESARSFLAWGADSLADGTTWASTSQDVDSLMMATGTPTLSGRQQVGPDAEAWRQLDPSGAFEDMWNRGGLHVMFAWNDSDDIDFALPVADTVVISTSPCTLAERVPSFRYAVSAEPLDGACLTEFDTFDWGGNTYTVYDARS